MTLEQLRIFVQAANYGNFTIAAKALKLSQAAVSMSVKKLEDEYMVTLFDRTSRQLELTAAGQMLLDEAERILRDIELTGLRLENYRQTHRRRLLIGCTSNVYNHWLPGVLAYFRKRGGSNDFEIVMGRGEEIAAWVMRGTVDVGISESDPGHPSFRNFGVFQDRFTVCAASPSSSLVECEPSWSDLSDLGPILCETDTDAAAAILRGLERQGVDFRPLLHKDIRLHTSESVVSAVFEGHFPGIVSERIAAPYLEKGRLKRIGRLSINVDYWCFGLQHKDIEPIAALISRGVREMTS